MNENQFDLLLSGITMVLAMGVSFQLEGGWYLVGLAVNFGCGWQFGNCLSKVRK